MPAENHSTFFTAACGSDRQPYGYQCRLHPQIRQPLAGKSKLTLTPEPTSLFQFFTQLHVIKWKTCPSTFQHFMKLAPGHFCQLHRFTHWQKPSVIHHGSQLAFDLSQIRIAKRVELFVWDFENQIHETKVTGEKGGRQVVLQRSRYSFKFI